MTMNDPGPTSGNRGAGVPVGPVVRRGARGRGVWAGVPLAVSLLLHAVLLAATALVVWRVNRPARPVDREVFLSFDDPAFSGAPADRPADPAEPPAEGPSLSPSPRAAGSSAPSPSSLAPPGVREAAPEAVAPALSRPVLRGRSSESTREPLLAPRPAPLRSGMPSTLPGEPPAGPDAARAATAVRFAGLGSSNTRSVVYAVDASGPMVSSLPIVLAELERSVQRLHPSQKFAVVLFRDVDGVMRPAAGHGVEGVGAAASHRNDGPGGDGRQEGMERFSPVLLRATPEAKDHLAAWLDRVEPEGRSNPLEGLKAALALRPEAVFLLSRGIERSGGAVWEEGLERTLAELDRLNPPDPGTGRRPVAIKTIQFLGEDPSGIMQAIGRAHGATGDDPNGYVVIRRDAELSDR